MINDKQHYFYHLIISKYADTYLLKKIEYLNMLSE